MRSSERARAGMLAVMLSCGCGSAAMGEVAQPLPNLPAPGRAMLVFVQPSTYAEAEYFPIFDERGQFLGDSEGATWFAVEVTPGPHEFYAGGENTAAIRAMLAPNRTYYVEVAPRLGWFRRRVQLLPIARRFGSSVNRDEWMAESRAQVRIANSALDSDEVARVVQRGHEILGEYDAEELERRTLRPDDGT